VTPPPRRPPRVRTSPPAIHAPPVAFSRTVTTVAREAGETHRPAPALAVTTHPPPTVTTHPAPPPTVAARPSPVGDPALAHPTAQRTRTGTARAHQRSVGNTAVAAMVEAGRPTPAAGTGDLGAYFGKETDLPAPAPTTVEPGAPPPDAPPPETAPRGAFLMEMRTHIPGGDPLAEFFAKERDQPKAVPPPAAMETLTAVPPPTVAYLPAAVSQAPGGALAAFFGPETDLPATARRAAAAAPATATAGAMQATTRGPAPPAEGALAEAAGAGAAGAGAAGAGAAGAGASGTETEPQTVEQWQAQVRAAANALPRVAVGGGGGGAKAVAEAAVEHGQQVRTEVVAASPRLVPPRPRVPEPPQPPPDPVPDATKTVRDAADKTLPDLVLPPFVQTPTGKTMPRLDPPPQAPDVPKEKEPPGKPAPTSKRQPAQREPADKGPPQEKKEPPEVPTLQDTRTPVVKELPPQVALRVGEVVSKLSARIPEVVNETLKGAREAAYKGGKLVAHFPDLDKDMRPDVEKALAMAVDKIAEAAGLEPLYFNEQVNKRRKELTESQNQAATQTKEAADAAAKKAKAEADKTAATIGREREKAAQATYERMREAMKSTKPQFITDVRDEILDRLRKEVTRGAAADRRAGERRVERVNYYHGRYAESYRKADDKDMAAAKVAGRGEKNVNMAGTRPWLHVRLEELAEEFKGIAKKAKDDAEALAKGLEDTAGPQAYELVREWAATRLGQLRDDDVKRQERAQDFDAQARRRIEAEAEVKAAENRDALLNDMALLDELTEQQGEKKGKQATEMALQLTEEQRTEAKKYFGIEGGPRDPIAVLSEKLFARITQDPARREELVKTLRERVEKIDPFGLGENDQEHLSEILFAGNSKVPDQIFLKVMKATKGLGTEEQDIYDALAGLTPTQARLVNAVFKRRHPKGWSLEQELRDEMGGSELDRALALARGSKVAAAAAAINDAIIGPGTNEKLVYSTLRDLSKEELEEVKKYYKRVYHESMDAALRGDFSDNELARAQALAAGDKDKADAYGLAEASRTTIWGGPDHKEMVDIHDQIRKDVGKANPQMTSQELDAEIRRRTGEVESSYEKYPGAGKSLKSMYEQTLTGPTKDLAIALVDNDMDGADAARAEIEARKAEKERRKADHELIEIAKARHERMLDKVRRDKSKDLYDKLADDIAARKKAGNPMPKWEREKRERDIQVTLNERAESASKAGMSTLEARFDEKYKGVYQRIGPNGEVLETKEGGFKVMREMFALGPEAKDYLGKGYLTLAEQIHYSVEGPGTNEERLTSATKGRTKEEIKKARAEYLRDYHEDMDKRIREEVDPGTRDRFDIEENLKGVPETPQEMLEAARRRHTFETTTYGAGGLFELAPEERKILDDDFKRVEARFAALADPAHRPTGEELERLYDRFEASTQTFEASADLYRKSVDALVDTVTQVVGAAVAIVVAVVIIVASGGTAAPAVVALAASLCATAATITTKMVLLGKAYGVEDLGQDLALGAVDAAISVATAGVGDKLLKAAKGAANPGVLARMAASSSKAAQVTAKAAAEVIENAVQAAPNALAATLLDDNTYRGDVFKNIIVGTAKGTAMNLGTGLAMGAAMHVGGKVVGGLRAEWQSMRGKPPLDAVAAVEASARARERAGQPGRPADVLELRGPPEQRQAAFFQFRNEFPGASYTDFLHALDNGLTSIQAGADAAHQMQRAMRRELLDAIPPDLRGRFAKTPIEVVSDADFEAFGRSRTGQAVVIIENGQPRVLVRESAPPGALREEGIHLWQSADPKTAGKVATLDESRMRTWDKLTVAEKVDLYRTKLDLELDAQQRLIAHLDAQLRRADLDPSARLAVEADLKSARQTFDNLHVLAGQVGDLTPADLIGISRGERASPVDLDQPSRLFQKKKPAAPAAVAVASAPTATPPNTHLARDAIVLVTDTPQHRTHNRTVFQIGPTYHDAAGSAESPWYRRIMTVDEKGVRRFTEENWHPTRGWVERGSFRTGRGQALEDAAAMHFNQLKERAAKRGLEVFHFEPPRVRREGFDRVVISFDRSDPPVARLRIVEVKRTKKPGLAEFTAIRENLHDNLDTLRDHLETVKKRADAGAPVAETYGMNAAQIDAALAALNAKRLDFQVVIGPESGLGPRAYQRSILGKLERSVRARLGRGADVQLVGTWRVAEHHLSAAELARSSGAVGTPEQRLAALAERSGVITPQSVAEARSLLRAETNGLVAGPVQRGPRDGVFYDGNGKPIWVTRPGGAGFKPAKAADAILGQLHSRVAHREPPNAHTPLRVILDTGSLTASQRRALMEALRRKAAHMNQTPLLKQLDQVMP
jgi:hypothetical protein